MNRKYLVRVEIHIGDFNIATPINLRNKLCNKVEFKLICKNKESYLSRDYSDGFSIITFHNVEDFPQLISFLNIALDELDMWDWICHIEIHEEPFDEMVEYDEKYEQ